MELYARNHCIIFIVLFVLYLLVGIAGVRQLMSRDEAYSEASMHDWDVNSATPVRQNDMSKGVKHFAERVRSRNRRRLSLDLDADPDADLDLGPDLDPEEDPEDEEVGADVAAAAAQRRDRQALEGRRALSASTTAGTNAQGYTDSEDELARLTITYRGGGDVLTPAHLQSMCEVENVVLTQTGYEENCINPEKLYGYSPKAWMRSCTGGTGAARCCLQPPRSIASLFYVSWAAPGAADAYAAESEWLKVYQELLLGVAWNATRFDLNALPGAPRSAPWAVGTHVRKCELLDADYVSARASALLDILRTSSDWRHWLGYTMSHDVLTAGRTYAARSQISFRSGAHKRLIGPSGASRLKPWLRENFLNFFGMRSRFLYSAFREPAEIGGLTVKFITDHWREEEMSTMVSDDFVVVIFSICFVFFTIWLGTRSLFIAFMAMLCIVLAFSCAICVYLPSIPYFSQFHNLAIFVLLGVGADDVFVFAETWKYSAALPHPLSASIAARMEWTYRRAAGAIWTTSFTTGVCFLATAVSNIMPLSGFGIFAAISVAFMWLICISLMPAAFILWEVWLRRASCCECCCCPSQTPVPASALAYGFGCCGCGGKAVEPERALEGARMEGGESEEESGAAAQLSTYGIGSLLRSRYAPLVAGGQMSKEGELDQLPRLKPCAIVSVIVALCFTGTLAFYFGQMQPPEEEERWFPVEHMFTGINSEMRDLFLAGANDAFLSGHLMLGMAGLERPSSFSRWEPLGPERMLWKTPASPALKALGSYLDTRPPNRGTVRWDTHFDLSAAEAQSSFLDLCARLRDAPCAASGCSRASAYGKLVQPESVQCFLERMANCTGANWRALSTPEVDALRVNGCSRDSLPTGAAFYDALAARVADGTFDSVDLPGFFSVGAGATDDERRPVAPGHYLLWVVVPYQMTMRTAEPPRTVEAVYDEFTAFTDSFLATSPASLATLFPWTEDAFRWMVTQRELVRGMLSGFAICFPMAFLVMLLVTGSLRIAVLATVTVSCIVISVLGFAKLAWGYALGTGETISGTIVIGLSVDYCVHLGHAYTESEHHRRELKMRDAVTRMGGAVVYGCISTLGCSLLMLPCQLTFFTKMASLMAGTIAFSIIYTFSFFVPMLAMIGPEGKIPSLFSAIRDWCARRGCGRGGCDGEASGQPVSGQPVTQGASMKPDK